MSPTQIYQLNQVAASISLNCFREICDCIIFNKLIRLEVSFKNPDRLQEVINNLDLFFSTSEGKYIIPIDDGMDFWGSRLESCSEIDSNGIRLIYLSPEKQLCDKGKNLDEKNDDYNLGIELKYPPCCIESYCKWQTDNEDIDPITTITSRFQYNGELLRFDFPNPFSRYFGAGLYSHFPCSLTCKETKQIAKKSLTNLQLLFPEVAYNLLEFENTLIIFQKEVGICFWSGFTIVNDKVKLDRETFMAQGKMINIFSEINEIWLSKSKLFLFSQLNQMSEFNMDNCFIGVFQHVLD